MTRTTAISTVLIAGLLHSAMSLSAIAQNSTAGANAQNPSAGANAQNPSAGANVQNPSASANAQNPSAGAFHSQGSGFTSDVQDPVVELQVARQRREQAKTPGISLFRTSPLTPLRERGIAAEKRIYELTEHQIRDELQPPASRIVRRDPWRRRFRHVDFHDVCRNLGRLEQGTS